MERVLDAPIDAVACVLADPRSYEGVVVGSKRVRWFDARWPDPGTSFHHAIGFGPVHLRDSTTVVADELPGRLHLRVGLGPLGDAEVEFTLAADGGGTRVTMREDPVSGPIDLVWSPPVEAAMRLRNRRALRRLEKVANDVARVQALGRAAGGSAPTDRPAT